MDSFVDSSINSSNSPDSINSASPPYSPHPSTGLGLNIPNENLLHRRHTYNGKNRPPIKTYVPKYDRTSERKRRSLNLSIAYSYPSEENVLESPTSDISTAPSSRGPLSPRNINIDDNVLIRSRPGTPDIPLSRKNTIPSSRPRSFQLVMEQEKLLQEQLQKLARTENARLMDNHNQLLMNTPTPIETRSFPSPSPISSTSILESAAGILSPMIENPKRFHSRHLSLDVRSSSSSPSNLSKKARKKRKSMSTASSFSLKQSPIEYPTDSMFIIRPQDIQNIESASIEGNVNTTETSSNSSQITGPIRPGNVQGTTLSWKMTSDLLTTSAKSIVSMKDLAEIASFIWSMFSRPENLEIFLNFKDTKSLLPPTEIVKSLRQNLPTVGQVKDLLVKLSCAGLSASIVCIQVFLLMIMVTAYVIGDIIIIPGKYCAKIINEAPSKKQSKKQSRKITPMK